MLRYRTNTEIYADRPYGIPPDDNDIRRSVRAHICPDEIRVIEDFYHWILVMPDPYDRECYSARTCEYLTECLHSDDPDCRLCNTDIYCEVRQTLHRIIRSATGDQVNMEHSFPANATPPSAGQPILTTTSIIENNKYTIIMNINNYGTIRVDHLHQSGSTYHDHSVHHHYATDGPNENPAETLCDLSHDIHNDMADSTMQTVPEPDTASDTVCDSSCDNLPADLQSPLVLECLSKLVSAGYLNAQFQPVNPKKCPWSLASVIAREIGKLAEVSNFYQAFGELWNHNSLSRDYQGFLNNNKKAIEIQRDINSFLA